MNSIISLVKRDVLLFFGMEASERESNYLYHLSRKISTNGGARYYYYDYPITSSVVSFVIQRAQRWTNVSRLWIMVRSADRDLRIGIGDKHGNSRKDYEIARAPASTDVLCMLRIARITRLRWPWLELSNDFRGQDRAMWTAVTTNGWELSA